MRYDNPIPEISDLEEEAMDLLDRANLRLPTHDQVRAFLEYMQEVLLSLPEALQPYVWCEWGFDPIPPDGIARYMIWYEKSDPGDEFYSESDRAQEGFGMVIRPYDEEILAEQLEVRDLLRRKGNRIRIEEPASMSNDNVFRHGQEYIDELMASGKWAYPVDVHGDLLTKKKRMPYGRSSKLDIRYQGQWRYIGSPHPSCITEEEFGHWLGDYWRTALGLPKGRHAWERKY
jgi:hypothetical protein